MKNPILPLLFALAFLSCEDEQTLATECGANPIFLEEPSAIISDPFQVTSASINGTCLEVEVSAGGCNGESWTGKLFIFPRATRPIPPQINVEFDLSNPELCEAFVWKTFSFDLSILLGTYKGVAIRLAGWDEILLLER